VRNEAYPYYRFQLNVGFRNLADTQARGALDSTDFAIGMYFIKGVMSNKISFIPISLPPGLYHQAGGGQEPFGPVAVKSHISGNSGSFSPVVGSFQQRTGQNHFLQPDITGLISQLFFCGPSAFVRS
jgi:epidermal growth factor receptor substrate 15